MKAKEICFCKDISSVYLYLFFSGQKECPNKHCGGYATLIMDISLIFMVYYLIYNLSKPIVFNRFQFIFAK
jgi:hypothetical protein